MVESHIIKLIFRIDNDAPQKYIDKWDILKTICENGESKKQELIIHDWLLNCRIDSIKKLPYLNRSEGGIGGDCNINNKQLRFRPQIKYRGDNSNDNDIVIDNIVSSKQEKWTFEELDDLIRGFRIMANNYVGASCINGYIEMVNKDSLSDNYLENEDDY